jgi:NADPH:quinone reductase-like Zn-dependent oxidoreductase
MLAIRVHEFGGPEVLRVEEVDIPKPGQNELLVRVMAAGVGPWDVSLRQGGYTGPLPYIPGGEFAGLVERERSAPSPSRRRARSTMSSCTAWAPR